MTDGKPFISVVELDQRDIDELVTIIGEIPHRHAVLLNAFFDRAYALSEQRKKAVLAEYQKLLDAHRASLESDKPTDDQRLH